MKRICALSFAVLAAHAGIAASYLKIEGVTGESQRAGYEDWIEVTDFATEVWLEAIKTGRTVGGVAHAPLRFEKNIDRASPDLIQAALLGARKNRAILETPFVNLASENALLRLEIRDFGVVSHLTNTAEDGTLSEEVELEFTAWQIQYSRGSSQNGPDQTLTATWDFSTLSGGLEGENAQARPDLSPFDPINPAAGSRLTLPFSFQDDDTPAEKLKVTAFTEDGDRVIIEGLTGSGSERKLELSFSALFSGTTNVRVVISDGFQATSRIIPVSLGDIPTPFEGYLRAVLGEDAVEDPQRRRPLLDPDFDQIPTLTEFYLGTDAGLRTHPGEAIRTALEKKGDRTLARLRFFRRKDMPQITGRISASPNMSDWFEVETDVSTEYSEIVTPSTEAYDEVDAQFLLPKGVSGDRLFFRLEVENTF